MAVVGILSAYFKEQRDKMKEDEFMAIFSGKEYIQRYDAGQKAVENGNWRLAFACFNDCLQYLKYYEPYRVSDIEELERLVDNCNRMFK